MARAKSNGNGGAVAVVSNGGMAVFDASKFLAGAENMARVGAVGGRSEFLRMDKSGDWYFGVNDTPVEETDRLYIDPMGAVHGWQCWADTDRKDVKAAALLGSEIAPSFDPMPPKPVEVPHTGREWAAMAGLSLLMNGHKLAYTTTSLGGLDAVAGFSKAQRAHYDEDPTRMVAVVTLGSDWYEHKKWGKTFVPIINIVGWVAAPPASAGEPAVEAIVTKAKRGAAGRAAAAAKAPAGRRAAAR